MPKVTKRTVDALVCNDDRPTFLWDDILAGFGVKALPSGPKRYVVKYRTQGGGRNAPQRWLTLGTHGQITPDQARQMAQQALAAVARGEDPQSEKFQRRSAPSLKDLWTRFEQEQLPRKKPHTQYDYRRLWSGLLEARFGNQRVETLSTNEVDRFHKSLSTRPYRANRALALLSRLMSLAEVWEMRSQNTNPCRAVDKFAEAHRQRFLSQSEIQAMNEAAEALVMEKQITQGAAHAISLLLLTGARVGELLAAEWAWLDRERKVLALPDSKTGKKLVYLSDAALEVLDKQSILSGKSDFVFPSHKKGKHFVGLPKSWAKVCARAGLEGVRIHDLRHTAASIAVGQGASLPLIGKLLGHTQAQTTLRYAHVDVDPALVTANAIGSAVAKALRGEKEDKEGRTD